MDEVCEQAGDTGGRFLKALAERRRFGMKPGLDAIRAVAAALGDPQRKLRNVIHVAGTNGKGAVCAILDAALGGRTARYTSPHLVRINERFFLNGAPVADAVLERASAKIAALADGSPCASELTFFEALTAVAFEVFAEADPDWTILETGLGGRLDATNICSPRLSVITKIGLDHCDWLGDTVEKIALEKAGIIKPGVPVVLARNDPAVIEVIRRVAAERGSPFHYAPELASDADIPADFPLAGSFNRENCLTAIAALKVLGVPLRASSLAKTVWPGRFQRLGSFLIDGAHNPPAARALAEALASTRSTLNPQPSQPLTLIAGFCGDKDALEVLRILRPFVSHGLAVRTNNPRSLSAEATAALMREAGIPATPCASFRDALALSASSSTPAFSFSSTSTPTSASSSSTTSAPSASGVTTLICGSLFLAGEAIAELGAYPWGGIRFDASESLRENHA